MKGGCVTARQFVLAAVLFFLFLFVPLYFVHAGPAQSVPSVPGFFVAAQKRDPWPDMLRSFGLQEQTEKDASVFVLPHDGDITTDILAKVRSGSVLILEGDGPIAQKLGIAAGTGHLSVRKVIDVRKPKLPILWEKAVDIPRFTVPAEARVLMWDRSRRTPLMAVLKHGAGHVLWLAVPPGTQGYERFPFLLQTLSELGVHGLFESHRLWAFFDPVFQRDRTVEDLAAEWRRTGLSAVHVGAWDFFGVEAEEATRLVKLIEACHRQGILVYAWLELPHVSADFWDEHPRWREKTATGRDAKVDWRYLMNLTDPGCQKVVIEGIRAMLERFDWDGVNFAELYFDGVEGVKKPKDFTPMNRNVREEVKKLYGFDPQELFRTKKPDAKKMRIFLDYRADLAARLQEAWIDELEKARLSKPHLDVILTHVDDRVDTTMRDAIGADAARLLKVLDKHDLTFIIEDPYTLWHLGPKRYAEIAASYRPLTSRQDRLGVDINIVQRQLAYPTKQQTGVELAQLIHTAAQSFSTVMYYYTGSITPMDSPLLPKASAVITKWERTDEGLTIDSPFGLDVLWRGPVMLDGKPWPVHDGQHVLVPAGRHTLSPAADAVPAAITDFTGTLENASLIPGGVEIVYSSQSRAFANLAKKPLKVLIDGKETKPELISEELVRLPRGKHKAEIIWAEPAP